MTDSLSEIIDQIKNVDDPDVINVLCSSQLSSITNLLSNIALSQASISPYSAILKPPSPTPWSIVSWLKNLITATAFTQLQAQIKLAKSLSTVSMKLVEMNSAIEQAQLRLNQITNVSSEIFSVTEEINSSLQSSFDQINSIHGELNQSLGISTPMFDTSSPQNFLQTADANLNSLLKDATNTLQQPQPQQSVVQNASIVVGSQTLKIQDGIIVSIT